MLLSYVAVKREAEQWRRDIGLHASRWCRQSDWTNSVVQQVHATVLLLCCFFRSAVAIKSINIFQTIPHPSRRADAVRTGPRTHACGHTTRYRCCMCQSRAEPYAAGNVAGRFYMSGPTTTDMPANTELLQYIMWNHASIRCTTGHLFCRHDDSCVPIGREIRLTAKPQSTTAMMNQRCVYVLIAPGSRCRTDRTICQSAERAQPSRGGGWQLAEWNSKMFHCQN